MTNEEAVKILEECKEKGFRYTLYTLDEYHEALEKAIEALKDRPTGHWIEHDSESLREIGYYRCSECNHGYQRYERGVRKSEVPYINGQKYELHRIECYTK